jgi:hypothetical protein
MNLQEFSNDDLLALRTDVEKELHVRGILFSVGQIGEKVAVDYFCSTPGLPNLIHAATGTKNVDAYSREGDRYSIKTIHKTKKTGTIYPDSINPDKPLFEYLLVVVLSSSNELLAIYRFNWEQFCVVRAWDKRMNAWYVQGSRKRLDQGEEIFINQHKPGD